MSEHALHELGGEIDERILGFVTRGELVACVQIGSTLFQTLGMVCTKDRVQGKEILTGDCTVISGMLAFDCSLKLLPEIIQGVS
jgi:hypothetical protein